MRASSASSKTTSNTPRIRPSRRRSSLSRACTAMAARPRAAVAAAGRRAEATEIERAGALAGGKLRRDRGYGRPGQTGGGDDLRRRRSPPGGREKSETCETPSAQQGEEIAVAAVTYLEAIRQALFEEMER